jgi:hypothetical protein
MAIAVAMKKMNSSLTTRTEARKANESSNPKIIAWESDLPPLVSNVLN